MAPNSAVPQKPNVRWHMNISARLTLLFLAAIAGGYVALFGALWLVRIRAEVWRRKAGALQVQLAGKA